MTVANADFNLAADLDNTYSPHGLGLAACGLLAVAGVEVNVISNKVQAGTAHGGTISAHNINVTATDTSTLELTTGALAASFVGAVGAGIAINIMSSTVEAFIGGATVTPTVGDVTVTAHSKYDVDAAAVAFSATGLIGGVGTFTLNQLSNTTSARIEDGAHVQPPAGHNVVLDAKDDSEVDADSAGVAMAATIAAGASIAMNIVKNDVWLAFDNATVTATGGGHVSITAEFQPTLTAIALGAAAAGFAAAAGMVTYNETGGTTEAYISAARTSTRTGR